MSLDVSHTIDSIQEGTKEVAETAHTKTSVAESMEMQRSL